MELNTVAIIISIATFVGSVISPIVVSLINNHHQSKRRYEEFYQQHRSDVIENYLRAVGKYIYCHNEANTTDLGSSLAEIYMYAPKDLWDKIDQMNVSISTLHDYGYGKDLSEKLIRIKDQYQELCKAFHDLGRTQKPIKSNKKKQLKK